eukprot:CFRG4885T1
MTSIGDMAKLSKLRNAVFSLKEYSPKDLEAAPSILRLLQPALLQSGCPSTSPRGDEENLSAGGNSGLIRAMAAAEVLTWPDNMLAVFDQIHNVADTTETGGLASNVPRTIEFSSGLCIGVDFDAIQREGEALLSAMTPRKHVAVFDPSEFESGIDVQWDGNSDMDGTERIRVIHEGKIHRRVRLIALEFVRLAYVFGVTESEARRRIAESTNKNPALLKSSTVEFLRTYETEMLDNDLYTEEAADVLPFIYQAFSHTLLPLPVLVCSLLHVRWTAGRRLFLSLLLNTPKPDDFLDAMAAAIDHSRICERAWGSAVDVGVGIGVGGVDTGMGDGGVMECDLNGGGTNTSTKSSIARNGPDKAPLLSVSALESTIGQVGADSAANIGVVGVSTGSVAGVRKSPLHSQQQTQISVGSNGPNAHMGTSPRYGSTGVSPRYIPNSGTIPRPSNSPRYAHNPNTTFNSQGTSNSSTNRRESDNGARNVYNPFDSGSYVLIDRVTELCLLLCEFYPHMRADLCKMLSETDTYMWLALHITLEFSLSENRQQPSRTKCKIPLVPDSDIMDVDEPNTLDEPNTCASISIGGGGSGTVSKPKIQNTSAYKTPADVTLLHFLRSILKRSQTRTWLRDMIKNSVRVTSTNLQSTCPTNHLTDEISIARAKFVIDPLRVRLFSSVKKTRDAIIVSSGCIKEHTSQCVWASMLLKALCGLIGLGGMRLSEQELRLCFDLIRSVPSVYNAHSPQDSTKAPERSTQRSNGRIGVAQPVVTSHSSIAAAKNTDEETGRNREPPSKGYSHFATTALCFLLTCPGLMEYRFSKPFLTKWVKSLLVPSTVLVRSQSPSSIPATSSVSTPISTSVGVKRGDKDHMLSVHGSHHETLLLVGGHFHTRQLPLIAELVRAMLQMDVQIHTDSLKKLGEVFMSDIFSEEAIATQALRVAATPHLSDLTPGYLPVHCVYSLMSSGAINNTHAVRGAGTSEHSYFNQKQNVFLHAAKPHLYKPTLQTNLNDTDGYVGGWSKADLMLVETPKRWVLEQIRNSSTPVHAIFPELIETFCRICIQREEVVADIMENHQTNLTVNPSNIHNSAVPAIIKPTLVRSNNKGNGGVGGGTRGGMFTKASRTGHGIEVNTGECGGEGVDRMEIRGDEDNIVTNEDVLSFFPQYTGVDCGDVDVRTGIGAPQVLMLYLALYYESLIDGSTSTNADANGNSTKPPASGRQSPSSESVSVGGMSRQATPLAAMRRRRLIRKSHFLLPHLPIRLIMSVVTRNREAYKCIYPCLFSLLVTRYRHLFNVGDMLMCDSLVSLPVHQPKDINQRQLIQYYEYLHTKPSASVHAMDINKPDYLTSDSHEEVITAQDVEDHFTQYRTSTRRSPNVVTNKSTVNGQKKSNQGNIVNSDLKDIPSIFVRPYPLQQFAYPANDLLQRLASMPTLASSAVTIFPIVLRNLIPILTDETSSSFIHTATLLENLWDRANAVSPEMLWVVTANEFIRYGKESDTTKLHEEQPKQHISKPRTQPNTRKTRPKNGAHATGWSVAAYTRLDFLKDPLLLLRVSSDILLHPRLLSILLKILGPVLEAANDHFGRMTQAVSSMKEYRLSALEQQQATVKHFRASAVVQLLLESACQETYKEIFAFIHHLFIEIPMLIKLVHFQTYADDLLPLTVSGIPSMHMCMSFIPELISQPDVDQQIFGVLLASHLAFQYPVGQNVAAIRAVLTFLQHNISLSSPDRTRILVKCLPVLPRFCETLPSIVHECIALLVSTGPLLNSKDGGFMNLDNVTSFDDLDFAEDNLSVVVHATFKQISAGIVDRCTAY